MTPELDVQTVLQKEQHVPQMGLQSLREMMSLVWYMPKKSTSVVLISEMPTYQELCLHMQTSVWQISGEPILVEA